MTRALAATVAILALLTGCEDGETNAGPTTSSSPTVASSALPRATAAPRPKKERCYRLGWAAAVAPTNDSSPVSCRARATSRTFHVGTLDTLVDGHLLTVDSTSVQARIAEDCNVRLIGYLGGGGLDAALSMFRAVWFSPTLEESDAGADWYRCDVIALAREGRLAALPRNLPGILSDSDALAQWGTCGTDEPGAPRFAQVICSAPHTWLAIATVPHGGSSYPGAKALTADRAECEDPARAAADDPLSVVFSYLAPTPEQWRAGRQYGTCWVPTR